MLSSASTSTLVVLRPLEVPAAFVSFFSGVGAAADPDDPFGFDPVVGVEVPLTPALESLSWPRSFAFA